MVPWLMDMFSAASERKKNKKNDTKADAKHDPLTAASIQENADPIPMKGPLGALRIQVKGFKAAAASKKYIPLLLTSRARSEMDGFC